jgi:hypothetical protein
LSRRVVIVLIVMLGALPGSAAAAEPEWHSEQPVAAGIGVPAPLGKVGGMAFWAPDKGVLVTGGNGGLPAGVYAYDGSGWYLYSTVCGGEKGGVAISGPDEFWTVAVYGEPQEALDGETHEEQGKTLCHFANGEVVASYAEPAASSQAFRTMEAAACEGPADCWFAGEAFRKAANEDPFHLHWDGSSLTAVPSPTVREPEVAQLPGSVNTLAFDQGRLFESASEPPYLREVVVGDPRRFVGVESLAAAAGPFVLSTEPFQQQLWAGGKGGAILRLGATGFETLRAGGPTFASGSERIEAIGVEPGTESAWLGGGGEEAEVTHVGADGVLGPILRLPRSSEELNGKGSAEHIVCPAAGQCWMVTSLGWLFHLGGPPAEGVNTDPLMHRLITVRPKDASSRTFVPAGLPADDSGEVEPRREEPVLHERFPHSGKGPALVVKMKQKIIDKTVLQLAFTLRGKAHVQLLAKYHKRVVAKTARLTLGKGRHRLRLHLNPKRWPTGLDFQVHAITRRSSK